ncbi:MAG: c-type cytochrome [Proteobacteria bacterium]|nr:c-type cytochrome [Pseudomonadota bacterium]
MRLIHLLFVVASGVLVLAPGLDGAMAVEGQAIVAERCVACHDIAGPAPNTFEGVVRRRAPDLFYAGSKFNRPWLVAWLQSPTAIRRAGMMFLNHVVNQDGKDGIREGAVERCAARLSPAAAEAVADYLMTLQDPAMKTGIIDPAKKLRKHKALRLFTKQLPCIGCHTIKFRNRVMGGISGPDLRGAADRLNPDWVYARIENPQYWDPKTWMPRIEMSHKKREMLTLFIVSKE